jgi:hypothetical protein
MRSVATWFVLASLCVGCLKAEPQKVVDLAFSQVQHGCVPDLMQPGLAPVVIPADTAYGRLRGESALPRKGIRYATTAMGRSGNLDALRLGNAGDGLGPLSYRFETGKPFTLEMWVYVYKAATYFSGTVLIVPPGPIHARGFSLDFQRAKWSTDGWLEWRWGHGKGSDAYWHKGFAVEQWHQIVITQSSTMTALYIDGQLSDERVQSIPFSSDANELYLSKKITPPVWRKALDYKLDQLTIYNSALTADAVALSYQQGLPAKAYGQDREDRIKAIKLEIPKTTYGYFQVGEAIPVLLEGGDNADVLVVNDVRYDLPLKASVELTFKEPGFQQVELQLLSQGEVLKQVTYPIAISYYMGHSSRVGAAEMASQQPEVKALGMNLNRVVVDWSELEPRKKEYDWTRLDAVMKRSRELGAESILCFTGIPNWVELASGSKNVPADLLSYQKMWRLLTNRYSEVRNYEVWSVRTENSRLKGSPDEQLKDYAVLLKAASQVIRQESPGALILAGRVNTSNGIQTAAYLEQNAADLFDVFSVRQYTDAPARNYTKDAWSKQIVRATGKPVWNTAGGIRQFSRKSISRVEDATGTPRIEKGWPMPTVDEWTAATWLIQDVVMQLADGIQRVILESGPSNFEPSTSGTTGLPSPEGLALSVFNALVRADGVIERVTKAPAGLFVYRVERTDGKTGYILFTAGEVQRVAIGNTSPELKCFDAFGNNIPVDSGRVPVSAKPIYLINLKNLYN